MRSPDRARSACWIRARWGRYRSTVRVVNIAQPIGLYELAPPGLPEWPMRKDTYENALTQFEQGPDHLRAAARTLGDLVRISAFS